MNTENFWNWFSANEGQIKGIMDDNSIADEFAEELMKMDPELRFEIGRLEGGVYDFVISCGGIKAGIPAVEQLYESAPNIPGWKFTKFKQPRPFEDKIRLGDFEFDPDSVKAMYQYNGYKTDVYLFFNDYDPEEDELFGNLTFIILDSLLGELIVMHKIGYIEYAGMEDAEDSTQLISLKKLKSIIENS